MTSQERRKELINLLYQKYGSLNLTREQTAESIGSSTATLDRIRKAGLGPKYFKDGASSKNAMVRYPIDAVVEYILSAQVQTA